MKKNPADILVFVHKRPYKPFKVYAITKRFAEMSPEERYCKICGGKRALKKALESELELTYDGWTYEGYDPEMGYEVNLQNFFYENSNRFHGNAEVLRGLVEFSNARLAKIWESMIQKCEEEKKPENLLNKKIFVSETETEDGCCIFIHQFLPTNTIHDYYQQHGVVNCQKEFDNEFEFKVEFDGDYYKNTRNPRYYGKASTHIICRIGYFCTYREMLNRFSNKLNDGMLHIALPDYADDSSEYRNAVKLYAAEIDAKIDEEILRHWR